MDETGGLTWYQLGTVIALLVLPAYAWIFARIIGDQSKLERRLAEHEEATRGKLDEMPDRYVRRDDFGQWKADVMRMLERIHADQQVIASKLDSKADKP